MAHPMVQINVRVEPGLYEKVKELAYRDKSTVSAVVTAALASHVKESK